MQVSSRALDITERQEGASGASPASARSTSEAIVTQPEQRLQIGGWRRHGQAPVLEETFVDSSRYRGTCYSAANWNETGRRK